MGLGMVLLVAGIVLPAPSAPILTLPGATLGTLRIVGSGEQSLISLLMRSRQWRTATATLPVRHHDPHPMIGTQTHEGQALPSDQTGMPIPRNRNVHHHGLVQVLHPTNVAAQQSCGSERAQGIGSDDDRGPVGGGGAVGGGVMRDGHVLAGRRGAAAAPDDADPHGRSAVRPLALGDLGRLPLQVEDGLASAADDGTDLGGGDVHRQGEMVGGMGDGMGIRGAEGEEIRPDRVITGVGTGGGVSAGVGGWCHVVCFMCCVPRKCKDTADGYI
mmetsp:Transcript_5438/g.13026  ORF Transcript_5438/g.13026 Transcript_5438/m.13026 type:complete len:273 (-) Transcript_5438:13-831(-)